MDPKKGSLFPLIGFPADRHRLGTGFSAPAVPTICIWWQNSSANGRKPSPNMLDSDLLYLSALALPLFVLCPVFFAPFSTWLQLFVSCSSARGSVLLQSCVSASCVIWWALESPLVTCVQASYELPSYEDSQLEQMIGVAGRDSATFATVCKFDVCVGRTNAIHSISQALIRNSKGRASRITLDTWQSEASCYLRTPQGGNSSQPAAHQEPSLKPILPSYILLEGVTTSC